MSPHSVSRLTLFAVISSFEQDLRSLAADTLEPQMTIHEIFAADTELYQRVLKRHREDPDALSDSPTMFELLSYTDFADCNQLLQHHRTYLTGPIQTQLTSIQEAVSGLAPIRNRVMHTRPLHFDDLAVTMDAASDLVRRNKTLWPSVESTLKRLREEPSFVLSLAGC
jgi:LuxR family transcriptional regulator, glucitol operon activator